MNKIYCKGLVLKEGNDIVVVVSDATVDRSGESIPVDSWDLGNFMKSPRMFVDHDYSIRSITGIWKNVHIVDGKLKMTPVFHDITELARVNKELVEQGFLDTTSVGFIQRKDRKTGKIVNELLETSWVGVPCNPNARVERMGAKGLGEIIKELEAEEVERIEAFYKEQGVEVKAPAAGDMCTMDDGTEGVMTDDGEGNLSCQIKPKSEEGDEKKGMTEDVLDAHRELREAKWEYLDPMFCAWCMFIDAYLLDSVAVEDIQTLTQEFCDKILGFAAGAVPPEMMDDEPMMLALARIAEMKGYLLEKKQKNVTEQKTEPVVAVDTKAGRVLSQKNRDIIQASLDAMSGATTTISEATVALNDLLGATEPSQGDEPEAETPPVEKSKSKDKSAIDQALLLRRALKVVATVAGESLNQVRFPRI